MAATRIPLTDVNGRPVAGNPDNGVVAEANCREADDRYLRAELLIPDDHPTDVKALEALGVPSDRIRELTREPKFGPRSGISDARRLLRAIRFNLAPGTLLADFLLPADSFGSPCLRTVGQ